MKRKKTALFFFLLVIALAVSAVFVRLVARPGESADSYNPAVNASQDQAPDFTLPGLDGEAVQLAAALEERKVLLVFGTTWCPACVNSVPELKNLYRELEEGDTGREATLLAINVDEPPEKVAGFVRSRGIDYPVLLDVDGSVARAYRLVGVPTYVVVNQDRTIAYSGHSLPDARRHLLP